MDKWDELTGRIQQAILAEEPEAAVATGFTLICEFGRTIETISADLDRIATAMEKTLEPVVDEDLAVLGKDDAAIVEPPVHDL